MFDGAILDVAIGMLLLLLVTSLVASAVVEVVAGFLHRRSKHLWDTLDLLLGNTSPSAGGARSIVDELYQQPFITGLVRPTDRMMFDPASTETPKRLPRRAAPPKQVRQRALVATRAIRPEELRRRFYGPIHLDSKEFTNALLAVLRPRGELDRALTTLDAIRVQLADHESGTDLALADVRGLLDELSAAAESLQARDVVQAIDQVRGAGDTVSVEQLTGVVRDAESAVIGLFTGDPTRSEIVAALGSVPKDLRFKLLAVLTEAGEDITDIRAGVENWYDRTMAAASSWYRKQTRWFLFLAGVVIAVSLNVDGVHAVSTLYRDESTRSALVALAGDVSQIECEGSTAAETRIDPDCIRDAVGGSLPFPVGWDDIDTSMGGWALRALGWILIAGSVTVGAPFWFDLLGRALKTRQKRATQAADG